MSKGVLALDLGLKTGWYNGSSGGVLQLPRGAKSFLELYERLDYMCYNGKANELQEVAIEEASFQKGEARVYYFGFRAIVRLMCAKYGLDFYSYHPTTVKSIFTGNGRATKEDMINWAKDIDSEVVDDNHADAIGVWVTHNNKGKIMKEERLSE